jgi:Protein of unknown function (DUF2946)
MLRLRPHRFGLVLLVAYALILQGVLWAQALGQSAAQTASVFCSGSGLSGVPPASHAPGTSTDHECCLIGCLAGGLAMAADSVATAQSPFARTIAVFGQSSIISTSSRSLHRARAPPVTA